MKEIQLTQGKVALVDDEDYAHLLTIKWWADHSGGGIYYARGTIGGKQIRMHRYILGITDPKIDVDHKDRDTLNNQRDNLRTCTRTQNNHNIPALSTNTSGYKGVSWSKGMKKWTAQIRILGKIRNLGYFDDKISAAMAYDEMAALHHGEFAILNFPKNVDRD